uniref:Uncharacterized protein n=1 Tax=Leersia perrieri TaxID=77586 RepID=A0A0D9XQB3_9ORYZ
MAEYLFNYPIVMPDRGSTRQSTWVTCQSTTRRARHPLDGGDQKRYASHGTQSPALTRSSLTRPKSILVCANCPGM